MRAGTAFVLTLVLLLGAGIGVDAWLTQQAEAEAAEQTAAFLGADGAEVRLGGWPASLRLVAGRVPEVEVRARTVPLPDADLALSDLEVVLRDVRLRFADLEAGLGSLRGAGGRFTAHLGEEAVGRLAGAEVALGDGLGQVRVEDTSVDVAASVEEGVVVLRPVGAAPEGASPVALPLPRLPGGAAVDGARIVPGALRLQGVINRLETAGG
jgi:hypothetical protein